MQSKVKRKFVSLMLAAILAASPIATLPMHVFAGTGKTGVYTLNGSKIKNVPAKKVWFFKSGAKICNLKLEGVPAGKTVAWTVIQGEDIATVASNGVVKTKGTKSGKVTVLAKCDGKISGCSFAIEYVDLEKIASDLLKNMEGLSEDFFEKENIESIKEIVNGYLKMSLDEKIAEYSDKLDKNKVEPLSIERVKLSSVEQAQNFSDEKITEILEGQAKKALLLQCPGEQESILEEISKNLQKHAEEEISKNRQKHYEAEITGTGSGSKEEKNAILRDALKGIEWAFTAVIGDLLIPFKEEHVAPAWYLWSEEIGIFFFIYQKMGVLCVYVPGHRLIQWRLCFHPVMLPQFGDVL